MNTLLKVQGLKAGYGAAKVLFGVDLTVEEGQVVTLLGRNGMGRSTTIKCLFGLLPPSAGEISLAGKRVERLPSYQIAKLGMGLVPEGRQVFPNLTVEENLVATARLRPNGQLKPWTLERVYGFFPRLKERRANLGSQLSGGEQQMLAIGRALMTNPELLILDEATEGLSPLIRQEIWAALAMIKAEGTAILIVDKNLVPLLTLADHHHIVEKGRVVWQGSSAELRADRSALERYLGT